MALPFDRTVPLANWIAKYQGDVDFPYKRYDVGYSFRGERSQKGRFQGFFQADIDIIGRNELPIEADAECIAVLFETISRLGIGNAYLNLNNIEFVHAILNAFNIPKEEKSELLRIIDDIPKLEEEVTRERFQNLNYLKANFADILFQIFTFEGSVQEFVESIDDWVSAQVEAVLEEVITVYKAVIKLGVPKESLQFKPCIVRGLDYYTGTVFETFIKGYEEFGSVASGGRYDDLASTFSKAKLPGFGGSIGLTRLFDLASKNSILELNRKTESEVLVCHLDSDLMDEVFEIASRLRKVGIKTDIFTEKKDISRQLKYANNKGIGKSVLVMGKESFVLKQMNSGEQWEFSEIQHLVNHLKFIQQ